MCKKNTSPEEMLSQFQFMVHMLTVSLLMMHMLMVSLLDLSLFHNQELLDLG